MPGEQREVSAAASRIKGTPNKLTIGRRLVVHYGFSLDGALHELSKLLIAAVPNPADPEEIGAAIDKYIHFPAISRARLRSASARKTNWLSPDCPPGRGRSSEYAALPPRRRISAAASSAVAGTAVMKRCWLHRRFW